MNILKMSKQAGLLIIVIVVIRAVALNRLPNKTFLLLWGIALLRLLAPFELVSPFSIYNLVGMPAGSGEIGGSETAAISVLPSPIDSAAFSASAEILEAAQPAGMNPFLVAWAAGAILVAIFFTMSWWKTRRKLRFSWMVRDNEFINRWLEEHQLRRKITVLQSDRISTPIAFGCVRPRIILPKALDLEDEILLGHILTHEYYHIRRFHAVWKRLAVAALCIHWFNPLVWVMAILLNRDLEIACDEMVIRHFGADTKKCYAYSLINMAEQRGRLNVLYSGFSRNAAEERITAIMKYKKTTIAGTVVALALVLCAAAVFATSARGGFLDPLPATEDSAQQGDPNAAANDTTPAAPENEAREQGKPQGQAVVYENVSMMRYEGDDGHPYAHDVVSNNTGKTIVRQQRGMLAYDKDGNPLEIEWNFFEGEASRGYYYLHTGEPDIAPGAVSDVRGGWSLNFWGEDDNAEQIAYVLYCDKEIEFEDGTIWSNPDFDTWRATYEGKSIDVDVLENYYPFVQQIDAAF